MADKAVILFSIDGALMQCSLARQVMEADEYPTAALDAVIASITTLRALIETVPEDANIDGCQHPPAAVKTQVLGGGHSLTLCTACDEIIEQV